MTAELSKVCCLLSLPLNRSFVSSPRGTHTYGAHRLKPRPVLRLPLLFTSLRLIWPHSVKTRLCWTSAWFPVGCFLACARAHTCISHAHITFCLHCLHFCLRHLCVCLDVPCVLSESMLLRRVGPVPFLPPLCQVMLR